MRFFDFFAGIGGFRLGMEMAGHECVGHCEIDKYANMSYVAMHHPKESEVFFTDVRTIDPWDMPECECYCFGFPCQAFSISGKRRGFADTRGTLFFEVMRIAKERKPQILFAENVAGLLNHEGGVTFGVIISTMAELGYSCEWQVLNSKDFGVPQHRQRVFIIGHLGRIGGRTVFPITEDGGTADGLQGFGNRNRVVSTPLKVGGSMNTNGIYIADRQTDRQTDIPQGQWIPQGMNAGRSETVKPKRTQIATPITARYYKGVANTDYSTVVYYEKNQSTEHDE